MGDMLHVEPIYGWGWIAEAEASRDVPLAMDIEVEQQTSHGWRGVVVSAQHEFRGARVEMAKRHVDDDGFVNMTVLSPHHPAARLAVGYARIVLPQEG